MIDMSQHDVSKQRRVAWFARPIVMAVLIAVALAWAVYLVVTVVSDPDLSSLEEISGYEFRADPALLVAIAIIGMAGPAIVCFLKGKVGMGLGGLVVPGLSFAGAVRAAKPGSFWERRSSPKSVEPAETNRSVP